VANIQARGRPPLPTSAQSHEPYLGKTLEVSRQNYGRYPNVIGVGTGLKYSNGRPQDGGICLHFYVRKKLKRVAPRQRLPKFVYARAEDGSIEYAHKILTDVIELKRLRFACRSGTEIAVTGESGTITLVFRNRAAINQEEYYLVTCAHVAGDLRSSPPVDPSIQSACCQRGRLLATTIVNATQQANSVAYDVALARLTPECMPQPEHQVIGSSALLDRFLPTTDIRAGMSLDCAFPRSNIVRANVAALRTSLPLSVDGREYTVHNLFLLDRPPRPGDSGGLLYDGTNAVGILVGMSDGWGLFQPLNEAFDHLQTIAPVAIRCF